MKFESRYENESETFVCKMSAISPEIPCVK